MQINISDETYQAIAARHGDVAAFVELAARSALAKTEKNGVQRFDPARVQAGLATIRAKLAGVSLGEFLRDGWQGLE